MKFFLTGATDEIVGHHLCKKLVSAGEDVTAITPSDALSSASLSNSRFKYLDVNPLEHEAIASVMAGHEVVVNILSDSKVLTPQNSQSILQGTRAALNAASRVGVRRFIHISSISVYGEPPQDKIYTEDTPRYAAMALYPCALQGAELLVTSPQLDMEVVVLQPGIVYGPGEGYWADEMLAKLNGGMFPLLDGGQGLCNLVHVEDLVDAIYKAATVPGIKRDSFIITNDQPIRWLDFFRHYQEILGKRCLVKLPADMMKRSNIYSDYGLLREYRLLNKLLKLLMKVRQFPNVRRSLHSIDNNEVKYFTAQPHFSNRKSAEVLGFVPQVDIAAGMQSIKDWLAEHQLKSLSA